MPSFGWKKNYLGLSGIKLFVCQDRQLKFFASVWFFFREISQNFISFRQPIDKMEIKVVWMNLMSWNFVRFHKILNQTDAKNFSCLSWKTNKFYSWKVFFSSNRWGLDGAILKWRFYFSYAHFNSRAAYTSRKNDFIKTEKIWLQIRNM